MFFNIKKYNTMKKTKIMLAIIITFLTTWFVVTLITYMLSSDISLRKAATEHFTLIIMVVFGWIPSVVIGIDLDKKLY